MSIDFSWLEKEVFSRPLCKEDRQALEACIELIYASRGMPIIHQGAEGNALYLLRSGSANVTRKLENQEIPLALGDKSKVYGEISLFSGEAVGAEVVADTQCIVYKITRDSFRQLIESHGELALDLMAFIVRNMGEVIRKLDAKQAHFRC